MSRSRQANPGARARRGGGGGGFQQQQIVTIAAVAVLVVAGLIVAVGIYVTQYRPPRIRILTVQSERFNARQVVDRGAYFTAFEGGATSASTLATDTLGQLEKEATLRQSGPALVGPVTHDDVEQEIARELGLAPIAGLPTPTPTATPSATATAEAAAPTPTSTATPTVAPTPTDRADFASKYANFLKLTGLSKDAFERIVEARIIQQRLQQQFRDSLGASGPQIRLSRIRVNDFALAQVIRQQIADGGDFVKLHDQHSQGQEPGPGGDIGWTPPSVLPAAAQDAVRDLKVGDLSQVVNGGSYFDIYQVTDSASDRAYDDTMKQQLVSQQVKDWLNVEQARLTITRTMSPSEETWLNDHILSKAQALAKAAGATGA